MNNLYLCDMRVLVNGKPVCTYFHNNRAFIEAKDGSEFEIEVKNNNPLRLLALVSVDGLSVLTGKAAGDNDPGYIVNGHNNLRIKGFRYSNSKVGAFKFTKKENSYAASQGNSAEKNCGVIGLRMFSEQVTLPFNFVQWTPIGDTTAIPGGYIKRNAFGNSIEGYLGNKITNQMTCDSHTMGFLSQSNSNASYSTQVPSFDIGTTWGTPKDSSVSEVNFERGLLVFTTDIFYASRESLIAMGVITHPGDKVNFPKSFPGVFATPPKGWRE